MVDANAHHQYGLVRFDARASCDDPHISVTSMVSCIVSRPLSIHELSVRAPSPPNPFRTS